MAKRNGKKANIPMRIAMVLLCLVLATMCWNSGLQARYVSSASGSDSARVARFDVDFSNTTDGTQLLEITPFALEISPVDTDDGYVDAGNKIAVANNSETTVKLTFDVTDTGNLGLKYRWQYQSAEVTEVVLAPGQVMDGEFLQLQAKLGSNSYTLHREIDMVTVTILCTQVD